MRAVSYLAMGHRREEKRQPSKRPLAAVLRPPSAPAVASTPPGCVLKLSSLTAPPRPRTVQISVMLGSDYLPAGSHSESEPTKAHVGKPGEYCLQASTVMAPGWMNLSSRYTYSGLHSGVHDPKRTNTSSRFTRVVVIVPLSWSSASVQPYPSSVPCRRIWVVALLHGHDRRRLLGSNNHFFRDIEAQESRRPDVIRSPLRTRLAGRAIHSLHRCADQQL